MTDALKKGGYATDRVTVRNLPCIISVVKENKSVVCAKDAMGASLFYKLSKDPLLTELNHLCNGRRRRLGTAKKRWAPCPCPSFSFTSSMERKVFLHGLCSRHFNVTVAKLFERATEIVKAEVQSSSIYFDGMRWEMMIMP